MVEVVPGVDAQDPARCGGPFRQARRTSSIIQGYPTYRKEYDGWGVIEHFAIGQVVTQDGYYRFRIKAKVDNRGRTEKNKFRLQYAMDSPIQVESEVDARPVGNRPRR